ncbi:MAG: hypothetical protein WDA18_04265 [Candidatus Ratteibacteria bacterium]|jgi:neutral ceramidase
MKTGFFETDITPPLGMEKPSSYRKRYGTKYHDPLKVSAAIFDDGKEIVALVGIDSLTCFSAEETALVRTEIEKTCGIPGRNVMIAASHTHTGGPLFGLSEGLYSEMPELVKTLVTRHSTIPDPLYVAWVKRQIISAVQEASRVAIERPCSIGVGREDSVAFNRRFVMKSGRCVTHPGKGNPDIVEPAGPVDPDVTVLSSWNSDGSLAGCVVNFACHGTTLSDDSISADWIYYMRRAIRSVYGPQAGVVFLNGACGDITQVNNLDCYTCDSGEEGAFLVGTRVGAEAIKVMACPEKGDFSPVRSAQKFLTIARRIPSESRMKKSMTLVKEALALNTPFFSSTELTFAKELVIAGWLASVRPKESVEIQAIQIGPAVFFANPSEFFCQLGLDIKKRTPFPFPVVVELANGAVGYVPTTEAFLDSGGGYETVLSSYSNLAPDTGMRIVEESVKLASEFLPGCTPRKEKIEFSGKEWEYGVLGPDLE